MNSDFKLVPLRDHAEHRPTVTALYEAAFPLSERRETEAWTKLAMQGAPMQALVCLHGETCCGFITLWDFHSFIYVEHFAVQADQRGCGTGGRMLDKIRHDFPGRPFVLEVEPGETEMARRRIGFYGRHGFTLLDKPYMQPPYRRGDAWFPLCLMSTDPTYADEHFTEIRDTLYNNVYGVTAPDEQPAEKNE